MRPTLHLRHVAEFEEQPARAEGHVANVLERGKLCLHLHGDLPAAGLQFTGRDHRVLFTHLLGHRGRREPVAREGRAA